MSSALYEERPQEIVDRPHEDRPDQQRRWNPGAIARPVHPDDGADEDGTRADLRNRENEHDRREQARERNPGRVEAYSPQRALHERGEDDAQRNGAYRLTGENHDVFTVA